MLLRLPAWTQLLNRFHFEGVMSLNEFLAIKHVGANFLVCI